MQREKDEYEANLKKQREELEAQKREVELLKSQPHFMNINSDPGMSGSFKKALKNGSKITIGKASDGNTPDIAVSGVGIDGCHTQIAFDEGERKAIIYPNETDP
jgi:hypothetical protein